MRVVKTKSAIAVAVLLCVATGVGVWLAGPRASAPARINRLSPLKQIGMTFRGDRNDLSPGRFIFTNAVAQINVEDRRTWMDAPSMQKRR
jgi:hypothetical protein